jgi:hypothetical protein
MHKIPQPRIYGDAEASQFRDYGSCHYGNKDRGRCRRRSGLQAGHPCDGFSVLLPLSHVTESLKEFLVRPWVTTIQILQGGGVSGVQPSKVLVNFSL